MPTKWRFAACFLSIFVGMSVGSHVPNGWQLVPVAAVVVAVYGLVYLVWRERQHRHGTA
jgi:hypothetical protein